MQKTTRLTLAMLLLATSGGSAVAETKSHWWQFGRETSQPSAPATVTPSPTMTPADPTVTAAEDDSWFHWPAMPKPSWPELGRFDHEPTAAQAATPGTQQHAASRYRFGKPAPKARPRNTWAQKSATAAPKPSTWQNVSTSTRNAWDKTIDFVTPGDSESPATPVARQSEQSWWGRMWHGEDKQEGPQTVTEWMAQDRIDP